MNILFLTITQLEDINAGGIYPDLLKFFHEQNHNIYMLFLREKENIILKQSFLKKTRLNI
jgi:L-rhamnose mutarotase